MTPEFGSPRTAIVTGGARRIGEAFTRALAEDGWHVLIHCSKSVKEAEALAAELANARVVSADLAAGDCADRIFSALDGPPPPGLRVNYDRHFVYAALGGFTAADCSAHREGIGKGSGRERGWQYG